MTTTYRTIATVKVGVGKDEDKEYQLAEETEVRTETSDLCAGTHISYVVMDRSSIITARSDLEDAVKHFAYWIGQELQEQLLYILIEEGGAKGTNEFTVKMGGRHGK